MEPVCLLVWASISLENREILEEILRLFLPVLADTVQGPSLPAMPWCFEWKTECKLMDTY